MRTNTLMEEHLARVNMHIYKNIRDDYKVKAP